MADTLSERIEREYALEEARNEKAVLREDIPFNYDAMTPEWLTAVICRDVPGARVTSFALDARDDGTSNRRRIFLTYDAQGAAANLPASVFCKSSQSLVHRLLQGNIGLFRGEVHFYNGYRHRFDFEAPQPIWAAYSDATWNSIIMLRDLAPEGAVFCDYDTSVTRQRAESQLRLLAELHGRFFASDTVANADIMTFEELFTTNDVWLNLEVSCDKGFGAAEDVIPPRLFRRRAEIWPATLKAVDIHRTQPRTFTHNDVHLRNWYHSGRGEMGLSDWQTFAKGHWGRDVAYAISTALTLEDRRAWEQDLLRFYLDRLAAAGGPKVGFDEAWRHYRQHLLSALTWWTVTNAPPPNAPQYFQPELSTLAFIGRMTAAIDDHDSLDSFD